MRHVCAVLTVMFVAGIPSVSSAQTTGGGAQPISQALRQAWEGARRNIKDSADLMPDANYGFKPVDAVRTFGQIVAHLAGANYVFCSAAKGEPSPHAEDEFEKAATTRASIIKALSDSLAYCDAAFAAADDKKLAEMVDMPFGQARAARAAALMGEIGHMNEHYGNLVTYFRLKDMVPPSSRR